MEKNRALLVAAGVVGAAVVLVAAGAWAVGTIDDRQRSLTSGSGTAEGAADGKARELKLSLDRVRDRADSGWDSRAVVQESIDGAGLSARIVEYDPASPASQAGATVRFETVGSASGLGGGQNASFSSCYRFELSPYSVPVAAATRLDACPR